MQGSGPCEDDLVLNRKNAEKVEKVWKMVLFWQLDCLISGGPWKEMNQCRIRNHEEWVLETDLASSNRGLYKIVETDNCNQDSVPQRQLVIWLQTRAQITEWKRNISFLYKSEKKLGKIGEETSYVPWMKLLYYLKPLNFRHNSASWLYIYSEWPYLQGPLRVCSCSLVQDLGFILLTKNAGVKSEHSETSLDLKQWNLKSGPSLSFGITFLILSSLISAVLHL